MKISYTAPGKIILSGEHSVVYTKPALVTAVDICLTCTITDLEKQEKHEKEIDSAIDFIEKTVCSFLTEKNIKFQKKPFNISFHSDIPRGRGMGSSAAFCVVTSAAISHFYTDYSLSKEEINTIAYRSEKHFHGAPSGVDVSASCFGGLIYYRKEFEFLKNISALHMKIPKIIADNLILIDTGKPDETTAEMVALVGRNYNQNPKIMDANLSEIEKVTKRMVVGIAKEDPDLFADSIFENQKLLKGLGIVSLKTENLLEKLSDVGCGKVTGAGGFKNNSGLVLFYIKDREKFKNIVSNLKIKTIPFNQQFEGVKEILES